MHAARRVVGLAALFRCLVPLCDKPLKEALSIRLCSAPVAAGSPRKSGVFILVVVRQTAKEALSIRLCSAPVAAGSPRKSGSPLTIRPFGSATATNLAQAYPITFRLPSPSLPDPLRVARRGNSVRRSCFRSAWLRACHPSVPRQCHSAEGRGGPIPRSRPA
jgi:hypothetical protein